MRLIIVSNRLPVSIVKDEKGYHYAASSGGLASGLGAYVEKLKKEKKTKVKIEWLGWPGSSVDNEEKVKKEIYKKYGAHCVFLSENEMEKFYEGFCNKTIWPLFHYFPVYSTYEKENWEQYVSVNETFCNELLAIAKPGDTIWIHDYHLMLLPAMVRKKMPEASIGFFLHIPFPSYELFRLMPSPWRKGILEGMLGADLIGFHTHDYRTYFLRSIMRILGLTNHMGEVFNENRLLKVDNFPMGIDYMKYHSAASSAPVMKEKKELQKNFSGTSLILSIDRQDYSKGILNRLLGYEHFLKTNPQWLEKVTLVMTIVPSRIGVESYQQIKSNIDELVGNINGKYGKLSWTPVIYQYRSLTFPELIALYNHSKVALVTPLRDGMNLVAKEFIAARTDNTGVLVLSEMAGVADELAESIIINPNNTEEIGEALAKALDMNPEEQKNRLSIMQNRIRGYDVFKWADDFLTSLHAVKQKQLRLQSKIINPQTRKKIINHFKKAESRTLFLDYDGTLVPYSNHYADSKPGKDIVHIVEKLAGLKDTQIIIISGRDRYTLGQWFAHLPVGIVAEHGLYIKEKSRQWNLLKPIRKNWMKKIIPILASYADKLPGSFIEEKEFSLVFHYRTADPDLASIRVKQMTDYLVNFIINMDVQIFSGNKILELRNAGIDKGVAVMHWLSKKKKGDHFLMAVGDDNTDEDMFRVIPPEGFSIKVGNDPTYAKLNFHDYRQVISLLKEFCEKSSALS